MVLLISRSGSGLSCAGIIEGTVNQTSRNRRCSMMTDCNQGTFQPAWHILPPIARS